MFLGITAEQWKCLLLAALIFFLARVIYHVIYPGR